MSKEYKARKHPEYVYKFPADRFELVEEMPPRIYEHKMKSGRVKPIKQHIVKLRCRKCGTVKEVCDKNTIGCKEGPCNVRFVNRVGKQYGDLTVLKLVKTDAKVQPWQWLCQCSCGKQEVISTHGLVYGRVSCEVCSRERVTKANSKPKKSSWNRVMRQYKLNALKAGLPFELTEKEMMALFKADCAYCGKAPTLDTYGLLRNGIDKKVNTEGYVQSNVVPCCGTCNIMKAAHTPTTFFEHIERIYTHMKQRSTTIAKASTPKEAETERVLSQFGRSKI